MITQERVTSYRASGKPAQRRSARETARVLRGQLRAILAVLVILAFVIPIYLTIANAFKTNAAINASPASLPLHPTLGNLSAALRQPGDVLQIGLRNSVIVVVCSVALLIPLGSAFSFWITRKRSKIRSAIIAVLATGLMIPPRSLCCRPSRSSSSSASTTRIPG